MLYDVFLVVSSGDTLLFLFVCLFAACNRSGGKTNLPIPLRDEESDQLTMTLSWVFFVYSFPHHLPSFLLRACVVCWRPGLLLQQQPLPIVLLSPPLVISCAPTLAPPLACGHSETTVTVCVCAGHCKQTGDGRTEHHTVLCRCLAS